MTSKRAACDPNLKERYTDGMIMNPLTSTRKVYPCNQRAKLTPVVITNRYEAAAEKRIRYRVQIDTRRSAGGQASVVRIERTFAYISGDLKGSRRGLNSI